MARCSLQLRVEGWFLLVLCVAWGGACRSKPSTRADEQNEISLNQNITVSGRAQDPVFKDFDQNWRQFVSKSPRLAEPVIGTVPRREPAREPVITPECVFSESAKGYVPRITISWNEAPAQSVDARSAREKIGQPGTQEPVPEMRIDLGLHHDPFARNYFSSALSNEVPKRFSLPSNSALLNDPEAVRLTGPGLFPQLLEFNSQLLHDATTNREFAKITVVVQELSPGLSYSMRVSRASGEQWTATQQFVFVSPVCPTSF